MTFTETGDQQIQRELGLRLHQERLNQNISQASLAERAGIARRTLVSAEAGEGMALSTLIAIMRELGMIERLDQLIPEVGPSPMQMMAMRGRIRQRASRPAKKRLTENRLAENPPWPWKE